MTRLLLVRHGQTEGNSRERFWGITDVKLSADGIRQAEAIQNRLAGEKIDTVYASDRCRAIRTAEIVIAGRNLEITICPELCEINFGALEGMNFTEISQKYPEVYKIWVAHDPKVHYPGGEGLLELWERVLQFRARLEKHGENETVLVVAHSASLRLLICQLLGLGPQYFWQFRMDLASLSVMGVFPQISILNQLNDQCYLEGDNK